jgi:hypothetical protein
VVLDTTGDGRTDAIRRIEWRAAPKVRMAVRRGSKEQQQQWLRRALSQGDAAVDTTGDGRIDSLALDTSGDGYIDTLRPLPGSREDTAPPPMPTDRLSRDHTFRAASKSISRNI